MDKLFTICVTIFMISFMVTLFILVDRREERDLKLKLKQLEKGVQIDGRVYISREDN